MKKLFYVLLILSMSCGHAFGNGSPQELQQSFLDAVKAMDADAIKTLYTEDTVYFPVDAMVGNGNEYVRNSWAEFFETFKILDVSITDSHTENFGDSAVSWGLWHMKVTPAEGGEETPMEGRFMDFTREIDGSWKYIVDHASIPFTPPPAPAE